MTGLLNPTSSEKIKIMGHFIVFCTILVVYLGHGIVEKKNSRTSAVSSTNFRSILIFASCVVGACNRLYYMGEFLLGGVLFVHPVAALISLPNAFSGQDLSKAPKTN